MYISMLNVYICVCMLNVHFQNTIVISRNLYYYYYHYRNYISIHGCCGS